MVEDTRVIWERFRAQSIDQIHMYKDGLVVAEEMLKLSENKLLLISGLIIHDSA